MRGGRDLARDPDAYEFDRLPALEAGCPMPTHRSIVAQDEERLRDAEQGGAMLRERLRLAMGGAR